jgi:hypothetical protein
MLLKYNAGIFLVVVEEKGEGRGVYDRLFYLSHF